MTFSIAPRRTCSALLIALGMDSRETVLRFAIPSVVATGLTRSALRTGAHIDVVVLDNVDIADIDDDVALDDGDVSRSGVETPR
jgi:hypothetical protein